MLQLLEAPLNHFCLGVFDAHLHFSAVSNIAVIFRKDLLVYLKYPLSTHTWLRHVTSCKCGKNSVPITVHEICLKYHLNQALVWFITEICIVPRVQILFSLQVYICFPGTLAFFGFGREWGDLLQVSIKCQRKCTFCDLRQSSIILASQAKIQLKASRSKEKKTFIFSFCNLLDECGSALFLASASVWAASLSQLPSWRPVSPL